MLSSNGELGRDCGENRRFMQRETERKIHVEDIYGGEFLSDARRLVCGLWAFDTIATRASRDVMWWPIYLGLTNCYCESKRICVYIYLCKYVDVTWEWHTSDLWPRFIDLFPRVFFVLVTNLPEMAFPRYKKITVNNGVRIKWIRWDSLTQYLIIINN